MKNFHMIVSANQKYGIGINNAIPWNLKKDLKFFQNITKNIKYEENKINSIIMGRKTFDSIPIFLKDRLNIVLSHQKESIMIEKLKSKFNGKHLDKVKFFSSLKDALDFTSENKIIDQTFIIGGEKIYLEGLKYKNNFDLLFYTRVISNQICDSFFPKDAFIDMEIKEISKSRHENNTNFDYTIWQNKNIKNSNFYKNPKKTLYQQKNEKNKLQTSSLLDHNNKNNLILKDTNEEIQYLNLIKEIFENGDEKSDRTGTGTISLFGKYMRFNLRDTFPILTTKRTFWKGVVEELIWFLNGETNAKLLSDKGIGIWDGNGSKEFLNSRGLGHRKEGDLGPVYGFQWRHFGAEYENCDVKYINKGYDQIIEIIKEIKNNPDSRRLIISAWNPPFLKEMALPPCHILFQFYVNKNELSCALYQRSADIGLGIPFNISSYSLWTHIIAELCDLKVGDFIHCIGDAHIYSNHKDALMEQLKRNPYPFPKWNIKNKITSIESLKFEDFEWIDYKCHKKLPMKMAV